MHRLTPRNTDACLVAVLCVIWFGMQWQHLFLDPWNDELYTLRAFVLVPFRQTVTDYHVPNNHLLFSLAMNAWRRVCGIGDIRTALDNIALLRLLPLFLSSATVVAVYLTAFRIGGRAAAFLAAVLTMSTVPFYNYGCQLRGYGLSIFIAAVILYEILRPQPRFLLLATATAGLLYTLPSNLYFLPGFMFAGAMLRQPWSRSWYVVLAALSAGALLAFVLYLPVWPELQAFSRGRAADPGIAPFLRTAPVVGWQLVSGRWLLVIAPAAALFIRLRRRERGMPERLLLATAAIALAPFCVSAIRGDGAPDRVYLTMLPVLCLSWGVLGASGMDRLRRFRPLTALATLLLCAFAILRGEWTGLEKALNDRLRGERCADLYYQYYLHQYTPQLQAAAFARLRDPALPVVNACGMDTELPKYIELSGVPVLPGDSLVSLIRRRSPAYAVIDGTRLARAVGNPIPLVVHGSPRSLPGVVYVRWSSVTAASR